MNFKTASMATVIACLALAGCQSQRMASIDTRPEPLPAAPAGTVTAGQLPPPATPAPSAFPEPPATAVAAAPAGPPADAAELTTGSVAGVWNASVAGQSCRIATPQTKFGQGYRAGPLRCPAPLDGVKSWNVAGKQLALYDGNGSMLAQLYSSGSGRFDGQTTSGQPLTLSR